MTKPKTMSKEAPARRDPAREAAEKLFDPRPAPLTPGKVLPAGTVPPKEALPVIRRELRREFPGDSRHGKYATVERSQRSTALDRVGAALARLTRAEAGSRATLDDVSTRLAALEEAVAGLVAGDTTTARALALVEEATDAARTIVELQSPPAVEPEPVQLDLVDLIAETPLGGDLAHDPVREGPATPQGEPVAADLEPARRPALDWQARPQALPGDFYIWSFHPAAALAN
ncbi:MAG: hypothetical protein OEL76_17480 [Siculibacillus sp.]|nr:hypothetical protein [Siculibacillus sp.]